MEKRILSGHRIPKELIKTPTTLLEGAGRVPGNIERLKRVALGHVEVSPSVHAFVLPKLRPYAPGPGFDNMIFVAKEQGKIGSIAELPPGDFSRLLEISDRLFSVYERNTVPEDPLVKEITAINYHADPVPEKAFDRKLYAQSLQDLHLHVVGFRASDIDKLPEVDRKNITQDQFSELHEPLAFLIGRLSRILSIQAALCKNVVGLRKIEKSQFSGIEFASQSQDQEDLSKDLIQLHHNLNALYQRIAGLFVDLTHPDASGMPTPLPHEDQKKNIQAFCEEIGEDSAQIQRLMRSMVRMGKKLKSGTDVQILDQKEKNRTPVFLRGLAYTLAIIRDPKDHELRVCVSLRLLSTGNLLATLGYCKVTGGPPPEEWVKEKQQNEQVLSSSLQAS